MISSRNSAISRSPVFLVSAARETPFAPAARLVAQVVVFEDRLFVTGWQLPVGVDRRCVLHLALGVGDLEVPRTHRRAGQGNKDKPVARRQADRDGPECGLVSAGVHIDRFQRPDLVAVAVDDVLAAPLTDVASLEHRCPPVLTSCPLPSLVPAHPRPVTPRSPAADTTSPPLASASASAVPAGSTRRSSPGGSRRRHESLRLPARSGSIPASDLTRPLDR